ncbi:hypothetical protein GPECTOR_7g1019 [Gonium pectorale]|uniref:Protein kinase domain-containing protein n=1 Tax=Gonium pectorale TaxID=33097 RepID=A0A150GTW2_GONPE|nr:hypothetical protein GPECTOR_7g1019 [Gonium pectorale]|eukprot:KXZ53128.1 hypothetical protein GPECTOR_7g1019 [Gonium pectorale]
MEFCDRGSLQDAIEQGVFVVDGPRGARGAGNEAEVDMELIIMTLAEVSGAMEYLHKHRITHRDLKPKNILLRSAGKDRRGYVAKVSDFGLSQVLPDTNKTQVGVVTHNLRPKFPASCPEWYKSLAYRCWRKDPKARPPFAEVTKTLLSMLSDKDWKPVEAAGRDS